MENIKSCAEFQDKIWETLKGVRQYRFSGIENLTVEKVWNRGQGRLPLFKFYPEQKIILINSCLLNRYDENHLEKVKKVIHAEDWTEKRVEYGYPDYYFKSFTLKLL